MATLTAIDPREEERAAREKQRQLDKLQRAAERERERAARSRLAGIIREELAARRIPRCRCGISTRTTAAELRELREGCTHATLGFICPTLDAIRRRMVKR